jgi:ABC-type lipoprotein release transport system permease subunit
VAGTCGYVLAAALAVWLIARLRYKAEFPFVKAVEAAGLVWMIGLVNLVLSTLLKVGKGSLLATPGPVLLLPQIDPGQVTHRLLAACDLLQFWLVAVLALALARLAGLAYWRALPWLMVPLILFKLLTALTGLGSF